MFGMSMLSHRRFHPLDIQTCVVLLDANDLRGLNDGDAIDTWNDISGNSRSVTGTTTTRPLFKTAISNGFPVVRFDGTDDHLKRTSASDMPTSDVTSFSVQYLNKSSLTFAEERHIHMWGTRATNQAFNVMALQSGSTVHCFSQYGSSVQLGDDGLKQNWRMLAVDKTGSGTSQPTNLNAYQPPNLTTSFGANLNVQTVNLTHFVGQNGSSGQYWLGDIMAIAVFSRILTASERKMLVNFWGPRVSITAL